MIVSVIDRAAEARDWGFGLGIMSRWLRTVEIADACPECGGPRGEATLRRFCEDGDWYDMSIWANACGHTDFYPAVLAEAAALRGSTA
jgi:hypothetical protein